MKYVKTFLHLGLWTFPRSPTSVYFTDCKTVVFGNLLIYLLWKPYSASSLQRNRTENVTSINYIACCETYHKISCGAWGGDPPLSAPQNLKYK